MRGVGIAIVAGSALAGFAVVKVIMNFTQKQSANGCPPNPRQPPAGYKMYSGPVSSQMTAFAVSALAQPLGTWVPNGPDGVCALLEWHYHTPGGPMKPWGCHKGATLYILE